MTAKTTTTPAETPFRQPPFDAIPAPKRTEFIRIEDIQRDERVNTRPVDLAWVAKKAEDFHPEALGTPIVSRRDGGVIIVLDGQNRVALCRKAQWEGWAGDSRIECEVHEGLTLVEEAGLFVLLAGHRSLTAMSKFLARQTQGDPVVTEITRIVELAGYKIGKYSAGDVITGVSTLEKIHGKDRRRHPHDKPGVLAATLTTIVRAWQHTPGATDQAIIDGIGMLFLAYGDSYLAGQPERELLVKVLAAYPGGPDMLKSNGAGARNTIGGTIGKGVAYTVAKAYSKEQPKFSKKLPDGRDKVSPVQDARNPR